MPGAKDTNSSAPPRPADGEIRIDGAQGPDLVTDCCDSSNKLAQESTMIGSHPRVVPTPDCSSGRRLSRRRT